MILPNDVLYIILGLLRDERDYSTLYQCALSSRFLAEYALMLLYQIHDTAPVTGGGSTEDESIKSRRMGSSLAILRRQQEKTIRKWSTMWRSLVLSTLDLTYLPYCAYIRYLNLTDLSDLLHLPNYDKRPNVHFFTPEICNFVQDKCPQAKMPPTTKVYPNIVWYTRTFGSLIIGKTTSIRGLRSDPSSDELVSEYLTGMPLLESLSVWQGETLKHTGAKIRKHCPEFKRLTVYRWDNMEPENADSYNPDENFLNDLHPHTLEHFEIVSYSELGPRSIAGIGSHINSLEVLKLSSLDADAIKALSSLPTPPRLKTLTLTDSKPLPVDDTYNPMVREISEWIHGCRSLRQLELRKFVDDTLLLSHALREGGPSLTTLGLASFRAVGVDSFNEALATQKSLQRLRLSGECLEEAEDIVGMLMAISHLKDLRVLELLEITDACAQDDIKSLFLCLPHLEQLSIGADNFDDSVWHAFLWLPKLKSLSINALSDFTAQGILGFITQLGPENSGFNLSIMNSTNDANLTYEEQGLIRDTLENSLGGAFDFGLAQGKSLLKQTPLVRDTDVEYLDEYSDIDSDEFSD